MEWLRALGISEEMDADTKRAILLSLDMDPAKVETLLENNDSQQSGNRKRVSEQGSVTDKDAIELNADEHSIIDALTATRRGEIDEVRQALFDTFGHA